MDVPVATGDVPYLNGIEQRLNQLSLPGARLELRLDPATATALEGYEFLTLAVDDRAALELWITHLDTLGITHSPPVAALVGWVLVIPDPDGRRLRLYTTAPHGLDAARIEYDSPWLSTGPGPEPGPTDGGRQALDAHHAARRMDTFRADAADLMAMPPVPEPLVACTWI